MRLGMGLGLGNLLSGQPLTGFPNDFSFNFDGSNDYLDCGHPEPLKITGAMSISLWVKSSNTSDNKGLITRDDSVDRIFNIFILGTVVRGRFWKSNLETNLQGTTNVCDGNWHHIAITFEPSTAIKIYVDGSVDATNTSSIPSSIDDNDVSVIIGSKGGSSIFHNGLIDEVAIWSVALSADDIAKIASKPVDFSKASTYATDRTTNLKLWLRAGDKVLPEEDKSIARSDFYTDFDSSNVYVDTGTTIGTSLGDNYSGGLSASAWINVSSSFSSGEKGILFIGNFGGSYGEFTITITTTTLVIYLNQNAWQKSVAYTARDRWAHICYVVDSEDVNNTKFYIDGISQSLTNINNTYPSSGDLDFSGLKTVIGNFFNGNYPFLGKISNLSIYQTALDAQTIKQFAKSRYTPMRDNRFSVVDFDGSNDYIDCGDVTYLNSVSAFTFSVWIKSDNTNSTDYILSKYSSSTTRIHLSIASNLLFFNLSNGGHAYASVSFTSTDWTHVAMVFDGSGTGNSGRLKGYVNGVEQSLSYVGTVGTATTNLSGQSFEIGRQAGGNTFEGQMSNVAVYSDAKGSDFIYAQYSKGITHNPSADTGLVGYWRMGDDTSKAYPTIADSSSNSNDGTITNGASDDIVQQMVAGYDMGAFESSSEELGEELIENGVISTNQFTLNPTYDAGTGKGVTLNNGTVRIRTAGNTAVYIEDNNLFESGALYKIVAVVSNATAGELYFRGGNVYVLNQASTVGTHIIYLISDGTSFIIARDESTVDISISSLSVKKVFQSEVSDTYPAIIDVNEPVLGVETITNGDFATDSDWTKTSVTISGGKANFSSGGTTALYQDIGSSLTGMYFISFEITDYTSGTLKVFGGAQDSYSDSHLTEFTAVGSYVEGIYLESSFNGNIIFGGGSFTGSIDNVSVKSVQGNVGNMTNQAPDDLVYSSVLPDQSFLVGNSSPYNFIDLGGTDEYISVDGIISDIATQTGTINLWAMPTSDNGTEQMLFTYNNNSTRTDLLFRYSWGQDRINVGIAQSGAQKWFAYSATNSVSSHLNNWNMITLVHDGTESKLYANGSELSLTYETDTDKTFWLGDMSGVNKVSIGIFNYTSLSNAFIGKIGQSAVWNKNLSEPEILAIYTLGRHGNLSDEYSEGLKGYWAMSALDASTGLSDSISTIYDRSGNSNHGTPTNADAGDLASSPNAEPNGYSKSETNRSNNTP